MSVGERIKALRKKKGLSQSRLGDLLDVSQQMIAQFENSKKIPKIETLEKIAGVLESTPAYLMGWNDEDKELTFDIGESLFALAGYDLIQDVNGICIIVSDEGEGDSFKAPIEDVDEIIFDISGYLGYKIKELKYNISNKNDK